MNISFSAAALLTLALFHLSLHSPEILSVFYLVCAFFTLLLSLFLAPVWGKTLISLTGLWWSYRCCQSA
ncbi:MAG: hypothetical protein AAFO87_03285 [Cyanobacteria bacterium J06607_6]